MHATRDIRRGAQRQPRQPRQPRLWCRWHLAFPATLLLLLSACGSSSSGSNAAAAANPPAGATESDPILAIETAGVSLKSLDAADPCADLRKYLTDYADQTVRKQLESTRDTQVDFSGPVLGTDVAAQSGTAAGNAAGNAVATPNAPAAAAQSGTESASAAARFTTTNLQTAGIDEPDMMKNDGRSIYQLRQSGGASSATNAPLSLSNPAGATVLTKSRYWPADQMAVLGQTRLPDFSIGNATTAPSYYGATTRGMFLTERGQAIVLRSFDANVYPIAIDLVAGANGGVAPAMSVAARSALLCPVNACAPSGAASVTRLDLLDVSADAAPNPIAAIQVGGRLIDARRQGDRIWLVTTQAFVYPSWLRWWPQNFDYRAPVAARRAQFDQLIAANSAAIRASNLGDWLPADPTRQSTSAPTAAGCAQYRKLSEPSELGWLRVASVNLADRTVSQQVIMAQGQMVYASPRALYVGTPNWRGISATDPGPATFVHKFAIDQQGMANYSASGVYRGTPLNAYSFDEDANGVLRFAANAWQSAASGAQTLPQPYSYVGTMGLDPGAGSSRLKVLSQSAPIAVGERLQSVRFIGARAYLVTFRQVDPLFVFDISGAVPTQLGELKVPGFSTYLHPIADTHLVGIGYDGGAWPRKIKASLFNVSDPHNPREQSSLTVGEFYSASEALWDPHAFNYLARDAAVGTLAIPLWSYPWTSGARQSSSLQLLNVSTTSGLSSAGAITIDDQLVSVEPSQENGDRFVRRSIMAEGFAFAVGNTLIRSARIAQPDKTVGTLILP